MVLVRALVVGVVGMVAVSGVSGVEEEGSSVVLESDPVGDVEVVGFLLLV